LSLGAQAEESRASFAADENPDAAPPDAEDVEAGDPRKDTPTE
jgi:hypothetical protein